MKSSFVHFIPAFFPFTSVFWKICYSLQYHIGPPYSFFSLSETSILHFQHFIHTRSKPILCFFFIFRLCLFLFSVVCLGLICIFLCRKFVFPLQISTVPKIFSFCYSLVWLKSHLTSICVTFKADKLRKIMVIWISVDSSYSFFSQISVPSFLLCFYLAFNSSNCYHFLGHRISSSTKRGML